MWNWVCGVGGVGPVHHCCSNATTDSQSSPSTASSDAAHNDADVTIDAGQTYVQDDDIGIGVARDGYRVDAVAGHDRLELLAF